MKTNCYDLFLKQSYTDLYEAYKSSLKEPGTGLWDYVVLTSSNEEQAETYRRQIDFRLKNGTLHPGTKYLVIPDPDGKRIGSGGATLNVLRTVYAAEGSLRGLKILVIHSGGDSKRIPQYSACGKLFSPVPRELENGRHSTIFDELIIESASICPRFGSGMLVCSGDVLLLFNPLQLDYYGADAAVLSIKEDVKTGVNHGVFARDADGFVGHFLHKLSEETLRSMGAVDNKNRVNIDTGAVFFSSEILTSLYSFIDSEEKARRYLNDKVRLSFYADFLFPMATAATLEEYLRETPEGEFCDELTEARKLLWEILHPFRMKMLSLSPASFIHFGTVREFLRLMTEEIGNYANLGWKTSVSANKKDLPYSLNNAIVEKDARIGRGTYIEDSIVCASAKVGKNCIISGLKLSDVTVPDNTVLHGLKLSDGSFTVRSFDIGDNPKENVHFGKKLDTALWNAEIFPVCPTAAEALRATLLGLPAEKYTSLCRSFNEADTKAIFDWQEKVFSEVQIEKILELIRNRAEISSEAFAEVKKHITSKTVKKLIKYADKLPSDELESTEFKIRIYYYLASASEGKLSDELMDKCYGAISGAIILNDEKTDRSPVRPFVKDIAEVELPVRVNFGGGWSDTPPYCLEKGGCVLNAAIKLGGNYPIRAKAERIPEEKVIFVGADNDSRREFTDMKELCDFGDPFDAFALHKAVFVSVGLTDRSGKLSFSELMKKTGGGIKLTTDVINIPRGSGLGTSSILAAACVKALYKLMGTEVSAEECCARVLDAEQLMSTGGGWQDQLGALVPGFKLITSAPGLGQTCSVRPLDMPATALRELEQRMCLIYTGQRRLARNLLRDIIGKYIASDADILFALKEIQNIAVLMKFTLEQGDIDGFAKLLDRHWELSKLIDAGCTNTCIDMIFESVDDLICGKMICGAGGGGFLQVILKKGVSRQTLIRRLDSVFADAGPAVWEYSFDV